MEFYTKLGIAATTITVIVVLVLWGMGYFSSPELSYVITPETATTPLTPFATAGSNIITMKSDGDFELVPVVNVNTPINQARSQRNQIRLDTATKISTGVDNAAGYTRGQIASEVTPRINANQSDISSNSSYIGSPRNSSDQGGSGLRGDMYRYQSGNSGSEERRLLTSSDASESGFMKTGLTYSIGVHPGDMGNRNHSDPFTRTNSHNGQTYDDDGGGSGLPRYLGASSDHHQIKWKYTDARPLFVFGD